MPQIQYSFAHKDSNLVCLIGCCLNSIDYQEFEPDMVMFGTDLQPFIVLFSIKN